MEAHKFVMFKVTIRVRWIGTYQIGPQIQACQMKILCCKRRATSMEAADNQLWRLFVLRRHSVDLK